MLIDFCTRKKTWIVASHGLGTPLASMILLLFIILYLISSLQDCLLARSELYMMSNIAYHSLLSTLFVIPFFFRLNLSVVYKANPNRAIYLFFVGIGAKE
jgi:hypothetical protein